ncbi:MAG: GAF domain-containing protein [Actinobacteria bacterium]|uniref:histidine kinase n=1 Tax=freshwater metagenome TaxID=449393 RepID=A0A6J6P7N7_9ZZZZ|nr:GAF domain-containing protein [Actinomycetota bacterium]
MTVTDRTDQSRVLAIDRYRVLLDPPRTDLIALVEIAAQLAEVPMATINLITDTEQHQIATAGFDASVCAREDSMCAVVLHEGAPVIVPDASQDPRFRENPFVTGVIGDVRFYATHQLRTPNGVVVGTLCVFDVVPRVLSDDQEQALSQLADRVVDLLELELRTRELTVTVAELQRTRAELERSNRQLAAFAGQVSHDLRNPLTAMSMSLDMVAEEVDDLSGLGADSDVPFLVRRAIAGTRRMQGLIDDLLSFARLGGELTVVDVDLESVVAEVREDLATVLVDADITVGPLPTVRGDLVQLRAVMQNLVANAAKFVGPGERPRLSISARHDPSGWLRVQVADRGLGIPSEERERVFEPLARAHHDIPGSGIGLATVRRVIDAHHGRIGIDETPGGGTTVWFDLPVPEDLAS